MEFESYRIRLLVHICITGYSKIESRIISNGGSKGWEGKKKNQNKYSKCSDSPEVRNEKRPKTTSETSKNSNENDKRFPLNTHFHAKANQFQYKAKTRLEQTIPHKFNDQMAKIKHFTSRKFRLLANQFQYIETKKLAHKIRMSWTQQLFCFHRLRIWPVWLFIRWERGGGW